jgi:hypothetical protein
MYFELNAVFSLSISIGAIIGLVKVRKADPAYYPFLYLLWLGLLNEIISLIIMNAGYSNIINYNVYSLAEALLITWQFKRWRLFERHKLLYYLLQVLFIVTWSVENFLLKKFETFNSYFTIEHSFIIVLMSIELFNRVIFKEPVRLWRNPVFLICIGMMMFFIYALLIEVFWIYGLNQTKEFRISVYEILTYINLITNLLFAFATIWIPMKREYILRY